MVLKMSAHFFFSTRTGFEGDIAVGGHNGVDTSMYAQTQVGRFER